MESSYSAASLHEPVTNEVARALADRNDLDPLELTPPLYEAVDTDALNSLFATTKAGPRRGTVTFPYRGQTVVVDANGETTVDIRDESVELGDDPADVGGDADGRTG